MRNKILIGSIKQKANLNFLNIFLLSIFISACGGGSSSSDGGSDSIVERVFNGTWNAPPYSGTFNIVERTPETSDFTITGHPCIENVINMTTTGQPVNTNTGQIDGMEIKAFAVNTKPDSAAFVLLDFPLAGGQGVIIMDTRDSRCVTSECTTNYRP